MINSHSDYERNPFLAVEDIARLLHYGSLMLFLGSGVSTGFGLPSWQHLITRILGKGDDSIFLDELVKKSDKDLAKLIDKEDDGSDAYVAKVYNALYYDVSSELSEQLSRSPLLLAVAALLTGSCRGHVSSVVTYNYDDLLSQYLQMLGYRVCIRKKYSDFSTWADVEINHVHGYLPQSKQGASRANELILSDKSYRERRSSIDSGWSLYVERGLYSKNGLFLGLSGDDSAILDLLKRAKNNIERSEDYTGYWIMTPSAYERNYESILDVGMCPIRLEKEKFPCFVFAVCKQAVRA